MPDTLCRLVVEVTGADQSGSVDLVLPSQCPLGELMPAIVCAIFGDTADAAQCWYLAGAAGAPLDTSLSLWDNAVRNGDIVVLSTAPLPRPRLTPAEPCGVVARTAATHPLSRSVLLSGAAAGIVLSAVAVVWAGLHATTTWNLGAAGTLSAAAATAAVAVGRSDRESTVLLSLGAIVFSAATGVLAVPGAGWAASSLLAAASALAMSTLLMRATADHGLTTACAAAAAGAVSAAAALCIAVGPRLVVAGAALAVISLVALSAAPRIAALATRLGPAHLDVDEERAAAAHRTLSALVAGWSASAMLGALLVAVGAVLHGSPTILAACFGTDLGVLLILRQRSHVDRCRRGWLFTAGSVALLSAFAVAIAAAPAMAHWVCTATAVGCVACVRCARRPIEPNPWLRNAVQVAEYAALVAVIPLAFWLAGLYEFVRGSSLS
ncbi:type VII secretion integral membrane protein EccD [Mycolicibacterium sp. BiH015]|uniref:type VII secretion integral membrane protein EccD n=1 Tax=Mycolicibacterium sp. BiH015 TaxID=3018808 RepID=UPI0022E0B4EA|nr:type VII secretion integral membrane protein EccD [Mycolicibacterium sp. BiH015]MDA2894999.1 type VII secretion integral membrane protein EccD [Mycolicibacterium sp. BiH015]